VKSRASENSVGDRGQLPVLEEHGLHTLSYCHACQPLVGGHQKDRVVVVRLRNVLARSLKNQSVSEAPLDHRQAELFVLGVWSKLNYAS
jgi:hypothetical protein